MTGRHRGFTLLEALVALVLLTGALAVILQIYAGGLRGVAGSEQETRAMILGDGLLAAAGREYPLGPGYREGDQGPFHWRLEVTDVTPGSEPWTLYRIDLLVRWRQGPRQRDLRLVTLRLGASS